MYPCTTQALILHSAETPRLKKGIFSFCMTPLGNDLQLYTAKLRCGAEAISVCHKNINYF